MFTAKSGDEQKTGLEEKARFQSLVEGACWIRCPKDRKEEGGTGEEERLRHYSAFSSSDIKMECQLNKQTDYVTKNLLI